MKTLTLISMQIFIKTNPQGNSWKTKICASLIIQHLLKNIVSGTLLLLKKTQDQKDSLKISLRKVNQ